MNNLMIYIMQKYFVDVDNDPLHNRADYEGDREQSKQNNCSPQPQPLVSPCEGHYNIITLDSLDCYNSSGSRRQLISVLVSDSTAAVVMVGRCADPPPINPALNLSGSKAEL